MNYEKEFNKKTGKDFNTFYFKYRPKLVWHLMKMSKDEMEAEEIADEAFLTSLDKLAKYDPEKAQYSTWLFTIASRLMLQRIKKKKNFESIDQDHDGATIGDFLIADNNEDKYLEEEIVAKKIAMVKQKIPELPMKYARVLTMREIDGLAYQDISDYLGLHLSTVKSQIRQGRILLKKKLSQQFKQLDSIVN